MPNQSKRAQTQAHLVGGGIASLAAAAHLIRDGKIPGNNIHIYEESNVVGGSLDGSGSPDKGYVLRGGRMLNFTYYCTYDLLSSIPSLTDPKKTVKDEIDEFNRRIKTESHCRLVDKDARKVDVSTMGFENRDRLDLTKVLMHSEDSLGTRRIDECFQPSFFTTHFWFMWATMFAFQPWHSAVEFKRYLHRFIHEFSRIDTLAGVDRTPYNQYDSIVRPIEKWLRGQGVHFETGTEVVDIDFEPNEKAKTATRLRFRRDGQGGAVAIGRDDLVFVTVGSMTAGSSLGSMDAPPRLETKEAGGDWRLWETIARNHPDFGRPAVFDNRVDESKWLSFTTTQRDPLFFQLVEAFTGNKPGTGALVTFKDSNWLLSIVVAYQPHFIGQPADVNVFWGYGLFPDKKGNYVDKPMSECSGREIMTELCHHFRFDNEIERVLDSSICIPCMMPFITSQFLTRGKGDRPAVIPEGSTNFAFLGQFCEIPDDVVFTVEYSVRGAQTAVYGLLGLDKQPPAMYKGQHDPRVLLKALVTMFK